VKLTDLPFVCLRWDDAKGAATGEYTIEDVNRDWHQSQEIKTFGILLVDDDKGVTIAAEITQDDPVMFRGLSFVPRGMVIELIHLGFPRKSRSRVRNSSSDPKTAQSGPHSPAGPDGT